MEKDERQDSKEYRYGIYQRIDTALHWAEADGIYRLVLDLGVFPAVDRHIRCNCPAFICLGCRTDQEKVVNGSSFAETPLSAVSVLICIAC